MSSDDRIPSAINDRIVALAERADEAFVAEAYVQACDLFMQAFELLPEPRYEWPQGEILLDGAAWAMLVAGDAAAALNILRAGLEAPALNSPLINLRIGQAFLLADDEDSAANHLLFTLLGGGRAAFDGQDPAFYEFATGRIRPPDGLTSWDEYEPPAQWPPDDISEWFELKLSQ